jgi:hypothetical protein
MSDLSQQHLHRVHARRRLNLDAQSGLAVSPIEQFAASSNPGRLAFGFEFKMCLSAITLRCVLASSGEPKLPSRFIRAR